MKKKLLIFIITYKAKDKVYKVFKKIHFNKLRNYNTNLLISDDFSNDKTIFYCNKIKKKRKNTFINFNKKNLGYGGNIKKCLIFAKKNHFHYSIMIHGDGQYSPQYISNFIDNLRNNNYSAVTGTRVRFGLKKAIKGGMPFYKLTGNLFLTFLFNFVFKSNFTDAHTGIWAYRINVFKKIKLSSLPDNYNFDQILRIKLIKNNFKIKEIPIKTIYRDERSNLHIQYALKFILIIFVYYFKLDTFLKKFFRI